DLVDAEPSVQVGTYRPERARIDGCLYARNAAAVDAADRLQARAVRGGGRRPQARPQSRRSEVDLGRYHGDELQLDRRARAMERWSGQERVEDTACFRPVATQGQCVRSRHDPERDREEYPGRREARVAVVVLKAFVVVVPAKARTQTPQLRRLTRTSGERKGSGHGSALARGRRPEM